MLRLQLGFDVKEEVPEMKMEPEVVEPAKDDGTGLPFEGRPFEQAPAQPPPKKIYEYPPPCKVAGLYEWPQKKRSDHRLWRLQMSEARKLP